MAGTEISRRGALLSAIRCAECGGRLYRSQRAQSADGRTWVHPHCLRPASPETLEIVHEAVAGLCARRDVDPVVSCELLRLTTDPTVRRACGDDLGSWALRLGQVTPLAVDALAAVAGPWYVGAA